MKKTMSREVDLGNEPVRHLLLVLAVPAITSQVVNALYNMVDRMYIGHIPGSRFRCTYRGRCLFPDYYDHLRIRLSDGNGRCAKSQYLHGEKRQ